MIKAFIFDMGGTLEDVIHRPESNRATGELLLGYLKAHGIVIDADPEQFILAAESSVTEYRNWSMENLRELSPYEIWSKHLACYNIADDDRIRVIADNVANLWERNYYDRSLRPEAAAMLEGLRQRGFQMGVISNTGCQSQVIEILHEYGIHHFFKTIHLSSISGFRKPKPELFWAAAADLGAKPEECVYVGDTISRDVRGSRGAGYGACIRIQSHLTTLSDARYVKDAESKEEADYLVENLLQILDLDIASAKQKATH